MFQQKYICFDITLKYIYTVQNINFLFLALLLIPLAKLCMAVSTIFQYNIYTFFREIWFNLELQKIFITTLPSWMVFTKHMKIPLSKIHCCVCIIIKEIPQLIYLQFYMIWCSLIIHNLWLIPLAPKLFQYNYKHCFFLLSL